MTYGMSALLGLVQGVAEFLPISSSGHLSLLQNFFGTVDPESPELVLYNVLLHFATLIAVIIVYRRDIGEMIVEFFRGIAALFSSRGRREAGQGAIPPARRLILLLIVGTLPLFVVLPFNEKISALSGSPTFIGFALIVTGFVLFFSDRMKKGHKNEKTATLLDALLVGCAQACAVVPGLSRSGCTISAGMARGYDRRFAVRYSFLLSLIAVLGATILEVKNAFSAGFDWAVMPVYLLGMVIAGVSGYFAIRLVNVIADKGKFGKFAYYCWTVGLLAVIASFLVK